MEGQVKFCIPQNTAGISKTKGVAVISQTIEASGDQFFKQKTLQNHKMPPYSCLEASTCQVVWKKALMPCLASLSPEAPKMGAAIVHVHPQHLKLPCCARLDTPT